MSIAHTTRDRAKWSALTIGTMYVYVVSYVMYVDLKPFKGVSTDEIIDNDGVKNQADLQYSTSAKQHYCGHGGKNGYHPPGYIYQAVGSYPTSKHKGRYGVDKFRVSWHMNIPVSTLGKNCFPIQVYKLSSVYHDLTLCLKNVKCCGWCTMLLFIFAYI